MSREVLIAELRGWIGSQIVSPEQLSAPELAARAPHAALVKRILSGPDGAAFLDLLARMTVLKAPTDPTLSGAAAADFCHRRTGENGVFSGLIHYLDVADYLERNPHDRSDTDTLAEPDGPDRYESDGFLERWDPGEDVAGR